MNRCARTGFTLIEVLVVLVIIMGLSSIVTVSYVRYQAAAKVDLAKIQIGTLEDAVNLYYRDLNVYPTQAQGLQALVQRPVLPPVPPRYEEGKYWERNQLPLDPWGNDYQYLAPGRQGQPFEILSYGSDGEPGGTGHAADLSSADL